MSFAQDILSDNIYEAGTALSSFAAFMTPDLARDVANDLVTRLGSAKPYVRKKATLITYKLFLSYPEALRPTFPRLKDRLDDQDTGVQVSSSLPQWLFFNLVSAPRRQRSMSSASLLVAIPRTTSRLHPFFSR